MTYTACLASVFAVFLVATIWAKTPEQEFAVAAATLAVTFAGLLAFAVGVLMHA